MTKRKRESSRKTRVRTKKNASPVSKSWLCSCDGLCRSMNFFQSSPTAAYALVLPFYLILPISALLITTHYFDFLHLPVLLHGYCLLEIAFAAYHWVLIKRAQALVPPFTRDTQHVVSLFQRALSFGLPVELEGKSIPTNLDPSSTEVKEFRQYFSSWFLQHPFEEIGKEDVIKWLAWSLFDKDLPLSKQERKIAEDCVKMIETRGACELPGGSRNIKSIRLSFDQVQVAARPLILYTAIYAWNAYWLQYLKSRRSFFIAKSKDSSLECIIWKPASWSIDSKEKPIVFLHGLGTGIFQYIWLILQLTRPTRGNARPIMIPLQPSLSMAFLHPNHLKPPNQRTFTAAIQDLIAAQGWMRGQGSVDVLSHSMGTILHAWLLKTEPTMIDRSCFVDAVCFCLFEPHVPLNFLYRQPRTGIEVLMRYFVARELGIALSLQRYFDWTANILWIQEIPNATDPDKTRYFLAGNDGIMSTPRVRKYLIERGVKEPEGLWIDWEARHGELLITWSEGLERISAWLFSAP